jgi:transcriptional regulator with XRE-family HTH domain
MPPLKPPPEALLIAARRKKTGMSYREAAQMAGISPTRWSQLEKGIIRIRGTDHPEKAPAATLAEMARAVGATPEDLAGAGRQDAAEILAGLLATEPDAAVIRRDAAAAVAQISGLTARQREAMLTEVIADLTRIRGNG